MQNKLRIRIAQDVDNLWPTEHEELQKLLTKLGFTVLEVSGGSKDVVLELTGPEMTVTVEQV